MSPLELPGRSFGNLPDRRDAICIYCGTGISDFLLKKGKKDNNKRVIILECPQCGREIEIHDSSKALQGAKGEKKGKGKKSKEKKAQKKK